MYARMRMSFIEHKQFSNMFHWLMKLLMIAAGCIAILTLTGCNSHLSGMFNPKGIIAYHERKLFVDTLALMLIVVLPVIIMSFTFVYHYQISHRATDYNPNWSHSYFLESLWWGIPCIIILVLATLTWKKTHELDPYNRIAGYNQPPMLIEVIALPWKWLFIYPEQGITTVNYLVIPVGQQVEYWITTDNVPMSAFFVPQLGSQIYTMAGMRTRLHLVANETGTFVGMNTQYNGDGFSDMYFTVNVIEPEKMQAWVNEVKQSSNHLTDAAYNELLIPSMGNKPQFFSDAPTSLFNNVIALYMHSVGNTHPRENITKLNNQIK